MKADVEGELLEYCIIASLKNNPDQHTRVCCYLEGPVKYKQTISWENQLPRCAAIWKQYDTFNIKIVVRLVDNVLVHRQKDIEMPIEQDEEPFELLVTTDNRNKYCFSEPVNKVRFTKPSRLLIKDVDGVFDAVVSSWRDVLREVTGYVREYYSNKFEELLSKDDGVFKPITTSLRGKNKKQYTKIGSRLFLYVNVSAEYAAKFCKDILDCAGIKLNNVTVELKKTNK